MKHRQEKKTLKMNRAAMTCGAIPGGLTDMPSDSQSVSGQKIFEVISAKMFPSLIITTIPQIQSPSKWITTKKNALTYNIIILAKTNDTEKKKKLTFRIKKLVHHKCRKKVKNILEFLSKTAQGRRQWIEIPKVRNETPVIMLNGILYPVEIAFKRKAKQKLFRINKIWENSLPADQHCKKH